MPWSSQADKSCSEDALDTIWLWVHGLVLIYFADWFFLASVCQEK